MMRYGIFSMRRASVPRGSVSGSRVSCVDTIRYDVFTCAEKLTSPLVFSVRYQKWGKIRKI